MQEKSGRKRDTIDKFYTKTEIVEKCLHLTTTVIPIRENDLIIEPSAGDGAFLNKIKQFHQNCEGYDIQPDNHEHIQHQDFLTLSITSQSSQSSLHIIGNPPFGRQSMLCKRFIKKSIELGASSISFILPNSFKKQGMCQVFDPCYHLLSSFDLPPFSFLLDKKDYHVPCVYQVWQKRDTPRVIERPITPTYWEYVKQSQHPHLAFKRIGRKAGIFEIFLNQSKSSHYFLRLKDVIDINTFLNQYHSTSPHFTENNTVGPRSISKDELNLVLKSLF